MNGALAGQTIAAQPGQPLIIMPFSVMAGYSPSKIGRSSEGPMPGHPRGSACERRRCPAKRDRMRTGGVVEGCGWPGQARHDGEGKGAELAMTGTAGGSRMSISRHEFTRLPYGRRLAHARYRGRDTATRESSRVSNHGLAAPVRRSSENS